MSMYLITYVVNFFELLWTSLNVDEYVQTWMNANVCKWIHFCVFNIIMDNWLGIRSTILFVSPYLGGYTNINTPNDIQHIMNN